MSEVYESIQSYREKHGENPGTLPDVLTHVHDSRAGVEYGIELVRGGEAGVCAAAIPRGSLGGGESYSVDEEGTLYGGATCEGEPLDSFAEVVEPGDTAAAEPAGKVPDVKPAS
jgi:hypothetical protein